MSKKPVSDLAESAEQGKAAGQGANNNKQPADEAKRSAEIGGRDGPEPTRFGDWEKNGRCIDF